VEERLIVKEKFLLFVSVFICYWFLDTVKKKNVIINDTENTILEYIFVIKRFDK